MVSIRATGDAGSLTAAIPPRPGSAESEAGAAIAKAHGSEPISGPHDSQRVQSRVPSLSS